MEAIILSSWNHIMGTLIEKLWLVDEDTTNVSEISRDILNDFNISKHSTDMLSTAACIVPDMEVYSVMCGQLLLSEIDSYKSDDEWASRFYVSEHKIIVAIVFHLPNWADCPSSNDVNDTCMCFGIIFKNKDIDFVLKSFAAIDQSLRRIIKMIEEAVVVTALSILSSIEAYYSDDVPFNPCESFVKGMHVDVTMDTDLECEFLLAKAFDESRSLTVVDMDSSKVYQSMFIEESATIVSTPPSIVKGDVGLLIPKFLSDVKFIQGNNGECITAVNNFITTLKSKSSSLIKLIEKIKTGSGSVTEEEIMILYSLINSADLEIIVGWAEKIKPGFRNTCVNEF
ncbi:uncharacterized protein TNIN_28371 [Trichonephila inaurata madagascariensis]|uniref:Uncharacterized protein n=1 Tax=Trichonephila inaurata madagascariensis TaxID=2747483 RepID=A0A8X6Y8Z9_9ARAC|nr:uncharacterized protein TNIN_28371 [Trichonephila inaurata madagascariensis]